MTELLKFCFFIFDKVVGPVQGARAHARGAQSQKHKLKPENLALCTGRRGGKKKKKKKKKKKTTMKTKTGTT